MDASSPSSPNGNTPASAAALKPVTTVDADVTCTVALADVELMDAVTVALPRIKPMTGKVAVVWPAGTVALAGALSTLVALFVNVSQPTGTNRSMQWSTDLIGYDTLTSYGSPAYYAQKMFSTLHGTTAVAVPMRSVCPVSTPSPKKSPGPSMATTSTR